LFISFCVCSLEVGGVEGAVLAGGSGFVQIGDWQKAAVAFVGTSVLVWPIALAARPPLQFVDAHVAPGNIWDKELRFESLQIMIFSANQNCISNNYKLGETKNR
jgi:hypothetical protein